MEGLYVVTYMEGIAVYSEDFVLYGFFDTSLGPFDVYKGCML